MKSLTAVLHVLNEAEFIRPCLRQVIPHVDEVIVMDHGSTDGTREALHDLGIAFHDSGGDNFYTKTEQYFRTWSAERCRTDWLLHLDGDEILADGWQNIIRPMLSDEFGGIQIPFHHFMGSLDYVRFDSPLRWTKVVRKHPGLRGCPSYNNTTAHSNYDKNLCPELLGWTPETAVFHCGYIKSNTFAKIAGNVLRGDCGLDAHTIQTALSRVEANVWAEFPKCVPSGFTRDQIPKVLRPWWGRYKVAYDPAEQKIRSRADGRSLSHSDLTSFYL